MLFNYQALFFDHFQHFQKIMWPLFMDSWGIKQILATSECLFFGQKLKFGKQNFEFFHEINFGILLGGFEGRYIMYTMQKQMWVRKFENKSSIFVMLFLLLIVLDFGIFGFDPTLNSQSLVSYQILENKSLFSVSFFREKIRDIPYISRIRKPTWLFRFSVPSQLSTWIPTPEDILLRWVHFYFYEHLKKLHILEDHGIIKYNTNWCL